MANHAITCSLQNRYKNLANTTIKTSRHRDLETINDNTIKSVLLKNVYFDNKKQVVRSRKPKPRGRDGHGKTNLPYLKGTP